MREVFRIEIKRECIGYEMSFCDDLLLQSLILSMNKRQIELQGIIKSLQSKIHALKRQNVTSREDMELKIQEAINKDNVILQEKENTIIFLKEEINKIRKQTQKEIKSATEHYEQEEKKSTTNLLKIKSQCELLEAQLNKVNEIYQKKLKEKQSELDKMIARCEGLQREKRLLLEQRQNFNKFYQSAIHKLPEREETLLWVDKLIEFMSKTQSFLTNQAKEKDFSVNLVVKCIKDQISQINSEFKRIDSNIQAQRQRFIEEEQRLIKQAQQDYDDAIKENSEFWDAITKFKAKEQVEQLARAEAELKQSKQNHKKQVQALQQELKTLEKQKKSIILNFQQMKNLFQIRDKVSKEQIEVLKSSIAELLESQQLRQKQFQQEIQRLGQKITQVTTKFYEKLDLPISQVSYKIKEEIERFKNQFEGFYSDTLLQKQLQGFQNHIVEYLVNLNNTKEERSFMRQTAENSLKIIEMIKTNEFLPTQQNMDADKQKMNYSTVSYTYQSNDKESREKENKLSYQLATVKKQLQKLKEHCRQLEGKSKSKQAHQTNSKCIQLIAQNELLKQRLQKLQESSISGAYSEAKIVESRLARLNKSFLEKLVQNSQLILKFAERQDDFIDKMSKCISSLNTFIINPLQIFEQLTSEISRIKVHSQKEAPVIRQVVAQSNTKELKKDVLSILFTKKTENNLAIQKSLNQVSKLFRQLLAKCSASAKSHRQQQKLDAQKVRSFEPRNMIEKRVRDVQTQRIKNRQQMLARLKILDDKLKKIEQKQAKKQGISFNKLEENILRKIQDMMTGFNAKEKLKDLGRIGELAFNDLQSKLKECMVQNQGLVKQNQLLRNYKR